MVCPCETITTYRNDYVNPEQLTRGDRSKIQDEISIEIQDEPVTTAYDIKLIKEYVSKCSCETTTVYRNSYTRPKRGILRTICDRTLCPDFGKKKDDGNKVKPPSITFGFKEYKRFVNGLEFCKKEINKLYHQCRDVNMCGLEERLKEMEKIVGEIFNYPEDNNQHMKGQRITKTWDPTICHVRNEDYRFYYCRFESLLRLKDELRSIACKEDEQQRRKQIEDARREEAIRKIGRVIRTGTTTYYHEICLPAIEASKSRSVGVTPADRYTERRV